MCVSVIVLIRYMHHYLPLAVPTFLDTIRLANAVCSKWVGFLRIEDSREFALFGQGQGPRQSLSVIG